MKESSQRSNRVPASFNRVTIDLGALRDNFLLLRRNAGAADLLAMVKADAYGHGMLECASVLEQAGCSMFGVAELREAVLLRQAGITASVFAMVGFAAEDAAEFCLHDITPVVYDERSLEALSQAAVALKKPLSVHLKVDVGMRRLGVDQAGLQRLVQYIESLPGLSLGGIAGHFPSSDDRSSGSTEACLASFKEFEALLPFRERLVCHVANSGGTLYYPESRFDMVRCGISLYGYYPEGRNKDDLGDLRPVLSFTSRVLQVKTVPAGCGVSYGWTYVTDKTTTLAVLPVGYEDGFSRRLSNCGEVLIRGRRAPVRGRVCMNLCMVDVTEIEGVRAGDEVVILGGQGEDCITADEIASRIGSISYEVLCMIGNTNEREFVFDS
ncbi:MAG: alanine racemase [Desulfopila sp.]|nr:alanine racemase [Desulfopila sp.]